MFKDQIEQSGVSFTERYQKFVQLMNKIQLEKDPVFHNALNRNQALFENIINNFKELRTKHQW